MGVNLLKFLNMKNVILFFFLIFASNDVLCQSNLDKYTGQFSDKELRHLLRRTMFGATLEDMKYFKGKSMDEVLDQLLSFQPEPDPPIWHTATNPFTDALKVGEPWINTSAARMWNVSGLNLNTSYWWTGRMLKQDKNIREKMILFFENHLPSNNGKDVVGYQKFYYERIKLLSEYSVGNYKELINKICTNAAMMTYLDHKANAAYKIQNNQEIPLRPNENFARELQEIYTVGKGLKNNEQLFLESDVIAASKILTGWHTCNIINKDNDHNITSYINRWCKDGANWTVQFAPAMHSRENKQFSSHYNNALINYEPGANGGQEEINQLIDLLFSRKETSENLARKIYRFFVYSFITDETERDVIQPMAKMLREGVNGGKPYDLKDILKVLLSSEHFYDKENIGVMIKNPADFIIGTFRTLGAKYLADTTRQNGGDLVNYGIYGHYPNAYAMMSGTGINLANVPDVAGYPAYYQYPDYHHHWLNAQTLRVRKAHISLQKSSTDSINFSGIITIGQKNIINYRPWDKHILFAFVEQLNNQEDVEQFVQQNIDHFLVTDLSDKEKLKLKNILNDIGSPKLWKDAWTDYKTSTNGGYAAVRQKLYFFYDALFSYAEFQLM
jgi:uncharacterized protein (DUF1800 family)